MDSLPVVGIDASRSYRSPATGTERYSRRLIESMLEIESPGFRVRLFFNQAPPSEAKLGNAEIRTLPARRFWTHHRLARELPTNPVDLLFVPSHVLPLYHPACSIATIHDLGYIYEPSAHTAWQRAQLRLTTRWNARRAMQLIAISASTRRDLVENFGTDPETITVIPHGVDERFAPLDKQQIEEFRQRANLPDRYVLFVGTIQPRKNLIRLIEAFEKLASQDQSLHFVLAGKAGWLSESITTRARASFASNRIHFAGHASDSDLPALYCGALAFAFPSLYEGFGLPALEAMACGVPVLISNRGALPELAGADSLVVDPLDVPAIALSLASLLPRRHDLKSIARRVRHARQFRWSDSARATCNLIAKTLDGCRKQAK